MYTIRPAREDDFAAMLDVLKTANMHYVPSEEMAELAWQNCFVAERVSDHEIVGMSGWTMISGDAAKTTLMAVLPECRGHNVGHMLQTIRMVAAFYSGANRMVTNADRPETIDWYKKKFKYKQIGAIPKIHEFGRPDVHEWTTLETNLYEFMRGENHETD
jgi:N-acetylglutamate synthase-like GNAT family acetyltransferase